MTSDEHDRVVAIGDLNGALAVLRTILRGCALIDESDRWIGGRTHLIQLGDIFDRGGGQACACLQLLQELRAQATDTGGRVTQLLGNHEVMAVLGDERWVSVDEYLAYAKDSQRRDWPDRVAAASDDIERQHHHLSDEVKRALLSSWQRSNVPGRDLLGAAMRPTGEIGAILTALPVAIISHGSVFCHAGLLPEWAELGLDGVEERRQDAWRAPADTSNLFRDERGPLWNRRLAMGEADEVRPELVSALATLGAQRMVVGHTPTAHVADGQLGRIATLHEGRLICIDVGLGSRHPAAALIVDRQGGWEWTQAGMRALWTAD